MSETPASLLAGGSRARVTALAVLAVLTAGLAICAVDVLVDFALAPDRAFADHLVAPSRLELWVPLLVAAVLVLAYRARVGRQRLELVSAALAAAPDGIQIAALDGTIAYSNEAVRHIYGYSPAELQGKHVNEMNADPTFASRVILPALTESGRWEGELEVKHKDGHVFPVWITTSVIVGRRGRPFAAIGVIRDVSDRRRVEQELREYASRLEEATALKELFADILRHDLLGPAATVQLSLDSILRRRQADPLTQRTAEGARRACAKLIDLIEGASKYAKLSAAQQLDFGTVELGALLKEVVGETELRARERNVTVVFEPSGAYPVRANPMIGDVFENLLSNALKYGPANGTIRVHVVDDGARWKVCVADEGEGIADPDKTRIFTRFERLRKEGVKGSGLGLAIAKRIVDLHGGSIWVEDRPGGGALFCVALAKTEAPPPGNP
jgi:PAS domain S-box-containing protein